MFYPKNVPMIERVLRVGLSLILIAAAIFASQSLIISAILIFSALAAMMTGFVGWCPACAMVGRKLKNKVPQQ